MDIENYISTRVDDQIQWYSKRSARNKNWYKVLQTIEIILAATIPILAGYVDASKLIPIVIGVLGAIITIIESVSKLNKFHENWIYYRSTAELLKFQKHLYLTGSSPYNTSDDTIENLFVKNIEQIVSSENSQWKTLNTLERSCPSHQDSIGS